MPSTASETLFIRDWAPALAAHRASSAACAERLRSITDGCAASHGKAHALECEGCHGAIVDEIRRRYLSAHGGDEWFSGRGAFLKDLGRMLDSAKEKQVALGTVEERIAKEKRVWYREVLRSEPYYVNSAVVSVGSLPEFHRVLDTEKDDEVARAVRKGIGSVRGGPIDPETYLSLLETPDSTRDDLLHLIFETDGGKIPEGVEPYADLYRTGTPITHILSTINDHGAASSPDLESRARRAQEERSTRRAAARDARRRLDELERARAAHTKIVRKKTEEKDKKLRAEFYTLPPCKACGGEVERGKVVACSLCQVGVEMGVAAVQTVYCSMRCCERAHESHVQEIHTCMSGTACLQHTSSPPTPTTTLCKECVHHHQSTPYCSAACAVSTLRSHLEQAHPALSTQAADLGGGGLADAARFLVGLEEVHGERIGKKVKGAEFVEV